MPQSSGSKLAHYTLVERIGQGGMGEVWRAHDEHLDREVAVKVLLPGALEDSATRQRFRREAHVLSRLAHPGVATVFDFASQDGVDFLVMEFVPGGTLQSRLQSGPLPLIDVLRLGAEIGDALDVAHQRGFLHRDLKPGNIALTESGTPKILDFGLAALAQGAQTVALTQEGTVVGSLPYMSPEQLRGDAGDTGTDIYALGVTLFEMTTGRRPYEGARPEVLMNQVLNGPTPSVLPLRPDASRELDRLISQCLSKEPSRRPASAGSVSETLRHIAGSSQTIAAAAPATGPSAIRSLAVLPFQNTSRDPAQEYFADGMTEALLGDLAKLKALRVISKTSAMKYKGVQKALPDIARELDVDAVLEGSALLIGNRVRISVSLISARSDETVWSNRYDRGLEDVLGLQSEVAEMVAREIAIQVTPTEEKQLAKRRAVNPEAHMEYMKGKHNAEAASPQATEVAIRHFRRALELDPEYAPAWAGLANCHGTRATRGMAPPAEATAEGLAAARRAIELDDSCAEGHAELGAILTRQADVGEGIRELQRAIELNPSLAWAHYTLGRTYYTIERHAESQAYMLKALSLDPLSMTIHTAVGDAYYYARESEKSLVYYRRAVELDPRFDGAHTDLARSLESLGHFDEAREQYEEGRRLSGGVAGPSFGLAHLEVSRGNPAGGRRILEELIAARSSRVVSAWGIAVLHASLGDVDEAFRWLDIAVEEKATGLIFLRVHPRLDPLRGDPRLKVLIEQHAPHE